MVSALKMALLDAAVATAEGLELMEMVGSCWVCPKAGAEIAPYNVSVDGVFAPSIILLREGIAIEPVDGSAWLARCDAAMLTGRKRGSVKSAKVNLSNDSRDRVGWCNDAAITLPLCPGWSRRLHAHARGQGGDSTGRSSRFWQCIGRVHRGQLAVGRELEQSAGSVRC